MNDYKGNPLAQKLALQLNHSLDCTLATVERLCMSKRSPQNEIRRQSSIAQRMLDSLIDTGYDPYALNYRATKILREHNGSVFTYAQVMRSKWVPKQPKVIGE
jgi:hypothetical protein